MNTPGTPETFRLCAEQSVHNADVRAVCVVPSTPGPLVATGSRDATIAIWDASTVALKVVLQGHDHYVMALATVFIPGTEHALLISGGSDKTIRIWNVETEECVGVLKDHHTMAICKLVSVPSHPGMFLSCSWDSTCRVWMISSAPGNKITAATISTLSGHDAALWSAIPISDGNGIVTAAADKLMKSWLTDGGQFAADMPGHSDAMRDLARGPEESILSVSNDGTLRYWRVDGALKFTCRDVASNLHDGSYIYAVDTMERTSPDLWNVFTGGEDNCLRITALHQDTGFHSLQAIMHPGTVWTVAALPNGDVVTGCSDGKARIFSADQSRWADDMTLATFEKSISDRKINSQSIGGIDVNKLQDATDGLAQPGIKDGQTKVFKTNGSPMVYTWVAADARWQKVGDVVDDPSNSSTAGGAGSNMIYGKKYDHVFEVEVGKEGPMTKLGFNIGESTYIAAQRFVDNEELSSEFLEQIVDFLEKNVPASSLSPAGGPETRGDPLTSEGRYIPGAARAVDTLEGPDGSPFTEGRYRPRAQTNAPTNGNSAMSDGSPFTESRYRPGSTEEAGPRPISKHIPTQNGMISFKTTSQTTKIIDKLTSFNGDLSDELQILDKDIEDVATKICGSAAITAGDLSTLDQLLKWPKTHLFPVLDLARLAVLQSTGYVEDARGSSTLEIVLGVAHDPDSSPPNLIMSLRFIANLYSVEAGRPIAEKHYSYIRSALTATGKSQDPRVRAQSAAVLHNVALRCYSDDTPVHDRIELVQLVLVAIESCLDSEEETLYRLILSLGTLMSGNTKAALKSVELGGAGASARVAPLSVRLKEAVLEIAQLIP